MKKILYGVYDKKADEVISEFVEVCDETAIRSFVFSIANNPFYRSNCSDFNLVRLCEFDSHTFYVNSDNSFGSIVCACNPELVKSFLRDLSAGGEKNE